MAPTYKLIYFNSRGRGELTRMLFAEAGVEYVDERIDVAQWPNGYKDAAPFGQLPYLEIDGHKISQSYAFARYVARKYNLAGKTDLEQAQADMIADCVEDSAQPLIAYSREKDDDKKAEARKKYSEQQLPEFLARLETLLKNNQSGDKFFVGTELTWADIAFINFVDWTTGIGCVVDPLAKFPKLSALNDKVRKRPKIAAWIEKRPKTDF